MACRFLVLRARATRFGIVAICAAATRLSAQSACPDSATVTRSIAREIATGYEHWRTTADPALLVSCWIAAVARAPYAHSDSIIFQALELSDAALRRAPGNPELLYARVLLLSRAAHYRDVPAAMDSLFVYRPSATTEETHRLTIAAVMQLHDTMAITNRLANAAARFPRSKIFPPEYDVWRQLPRLRALIDTVHRIIRSDPTLTVGLINLSSIYGSLDQPDSAILYAKRAIRAGQSRDAVGKGLESLLGVRMRRAKILDTPETWVRTLSIARRVDSTLSTPASKYLIALTLAEIVKGDTRLAQYIAYGLDNGEDNGFGRQATSASGRSYVRVMTCENLTELERMISESHAKLAAGGDTFLVETVPALRNGLTAMTAILAQLKPRCPS
jgi:hypothetical protein